MGPPLADRFLQLLGWALICGIVAMVPEGANAQQEAITATVIGEKVQKVLPGVDRETSNYV